MVTINSLEAAHTFTRTFGMAAVDFVLDNRTLPQESCAWLVFMKTNAERRVLGVDSFNDGNSEWEITAVLHVTDLGNIDLGATTIVRQGFGSSEMNISKAVDDIITKEQVGWIVSQIRSIQESMDCMLIK